jgi:hypothetical protein
VGWLVGVWWGRGGAYEDGGCQHDEACVEAFDVRVEGWVEDFLEGDALEDGHETGFCQFFSVGVGGRQRMGDSQAGEEDC